MKYLLDTNICIYIIKQKPEKVFNKFKKLSVGQIAISSITYSELYYGVQRSQKVSQNEAALHQFVAPLDVLPYPEDASTVYGQIRAALEPSGCPIGPLDTLIAAHAQYIGFTLVTNNLKEFSRVPKLKTENWA